MRLDRVVTAGTVVAIGLAVHTAVNLRFLRRPPVDAPPIRERVSAPPCLPLLAAGFLP